LLGALAVWALLLGLNRLFRIMRLWPYLLGGAAMWFLMLKSGVHATLAGVAVAMFIPGKRDAAGNSPLATLEHALRSWVIYAIVPVFAFANAGVALGGIDWGKFPIDVALGISCGLLFGKAIGVFLACWLAVKIGERFLLVQADEIIYASMADESITVVTSLHAGTSNYRTLDELQAHLDPSVFWRVHRSHLVNINKIKEIVPWFSRNYILRMKDEKATEIPVSRMQTKRLREYLKL